MESPEGVMRGTPARPGPEPKTMPDNPLFSQADVAKCRNRRGFPFDPRARREMAPCDRIPEVAAADAPRRVARAHPERRDPARASPARLVARVRAGRCRGIRE